MLRIVPSTEIHPTEAFRLIDMIEKRCFNGDYVTEEYFQGYTQCAYFLFEETSVVGFCFASMEEGVHYLYSIAVLPEYQGRGHSKRLLELFLKETSLGSHEAHWLHVKESNRVAINLYEKYGFCTVDWEDDFYEDGTRALIMRKGYES